MTELVAVYENAPDNSGRVMELMQQMQACGTPPQEILVRERGHSTTACMVLRQGTAAAKTVAVSASQRSLSAAAGNPRSLV